MPDDQYLETQVMTASPLQLHLMVVDGAIRFAKHAMQALHESDIETAHSSLNKSRDFVSELIGGLRPDHAPELVDRLKGLFLFVHRSLVNADLNRDPTQVADALKVLELHRDASVKLIDKLRQQNSTEAAGKRETSWTT